MSEPQGLGAAVPLRRKARQYQSFDDVTGGSQSQAKLARLRLNRLGRLAGKAVLDLGCNEGFFCGAVLAKGATRVVGVDRSGPVLARARERFPDVEFRAGSWWDAIPDEQFDLILFLSAIHYEPNQKALLDKLLRHLKPEGVLVLECGLALPQHGSGWIQIMRPRDTVMRRYPTLEYLKRHLMPEYAVAGVGPSVPQKGDPIPRWVLHCRRRKPVVLVLGGRSGVGKSHFGAEFGNRDTPVYRTDGLFTRLVNSAYYEHVPLAIALRATGLTSCAVLSKTVAANEELTAQFCEMVCGEAPLEAPAAILEGEAFAHPQIMRKMEEMLRSRGAVVWTASRSGEIGYAEPEETVSEPAEL